jgi:choline dehydrogenase
MSKKKVIIVGAGTAGLTIASQLKDQFQVIVLEKSGHSKYPLKFSIPLMIGYLFRSNSQSFISKRELQLENGRVIPFFESCVLGGASVINGCVHTIGSKIIWERILRKFNASYNDVLNGYNYLYTMDRATKGKINLVLAAQNEVDREFISTLTNKHIKLSDTNFSDEQNCGQIYNTCSRLFRSSVLSFFNDAQSQLLLNHKVERLLFNNEGRVTGVATANGEIEADHVILTSGVIGTCSLLLQEKKRAKLDGFGLSGIDVGVGIQDHTNLRVNVITKKQIGSLNEISSSFMKKIFMVIKHFFGLPTLMTGTGATSTVQLDLDGDGIVDTRINVVQFTETGRHGSDGKYFDAEPGFSLSITPINPVSRGAISMSEIGVDIRPNYLTDKHDVEILKSALIFCLELLRSEPLCELVKYVVNIEKIENDPESYIRENIYSGHHLVGGAQSLVDGNFTVKGVSGLSICDASILDDYPASNIHSSVVLLANIFSKRFCDL